MLLHIWLRIKLLKDDLVMVVVMLAMAIVLTMIFGQAFGGDFVPTIAVVDNDMSQQSEAFTESIGDIEGFEFKIHSQKDMEAQVQENTVLAGIVLEEGFKDDVSKIRIVTGKSAIEVMQLKHTLLKLIGEMTNKENLSVAITQTLDIQVDIKEQVSTAFNTRYSDKSFIVGNTATGTSQWTDYNGLMHYVLGFMLFFSTFPMIYVMADILREKKLHVFQRNLVTPINRASQLFAKMFVTFLLGFGQIIIVMLCGKYLFGIEWGDNMGMLLLISGCYVLTFTCLGLFLSSIIKSYDQLGAMSPIILVSTAMLGGCMWPLEIITSKVLLLAGDITPQKWALTAMEEIAMRGAAPSTALTSILVLLGMAAVYFLLGMRVMKKN
ncbi:MAG: ABC transporter permease, partial [Clostridiales bacterium]|nr:ABC transporter permease [Clostridiales bacterium]